MANILHSPSQIVIFKKDNLSFLDKKNSDSGSTTGLYVVISVISLLLAIAVVVILFQKFTYTKTMISWRQSASKTCSYYDPQNYGNPTVFEEMHQYSTMDYTKQDSDYQNTA